MNSLIAPAPLRLSSTLPKVAPPNRVLPTDSIASYTFAQASRSRRGTELKASWASSDQFARRLELLIGELLMELVT